MYVSFKQYSDEKIIYMCFNPPHKVMYFKGIHVNSLLQCHSIVQTQKYS